jgi:hypothetical protein
MKCVVASLLVVIVLFTPALSIACSMLSEDLDDYSLLRMVEKSELVVFGIVANLDGVWREGDHEGYHGITTDVVVRVETLIKGETNAGKHYIKFMIQGGHGVNERTGELVSMSVSSEPEFELGEKVMLFLSNVSYPTDYYYANYPHGGYYLIGAQEGKKELEDGKVIFGYPQGDLPLIGVDIPLELAVVLARAFLKDKEAAILLEDEIKFTARGNTSGRVVLPDALVTRLIEKSKEIVDKAEEE